jgi:hypothetical protein
MTLRLRLSHCPSSNTATTNRVAENLRSSPCCWWHARRSDRGRSCANVRGCSLRRQIAAIPLSCAIPSTPIFANDAVAARKSASRCSAAATAATRIADREIPCASFASAASVRNDASLSWRGRSVPTWRWSLGVEAFQDRRFRGTRRSAVVGSRGKPAQGEGQRVAGSFRPCSRASRGSQRQRGRQLIVAVDTSVLVYFFDQQASAPITSTGAPVSECKDHPDLSISSLKREKAEIVVPAPAPGELLVKAREAGPEWLANLDSRATSASRASTNARTWSLPQPRRNESHQVKRKKARRAQR